MRLFRSKNVYGPYTDAAGHNAKSNNTRYFDSIGIKLIGNYQFTGTSFGYLSAGHNSAFIDDDGQRYLVYHQRFTNMGEGHQLRIRRQYLNEDNWPVETIYEYRDTDEKIENYDTTEVLGTYEIINHGTNTPSSAALLSTQSIHINADGTVSGDMTGTWTKKNSGKGYDYITITSGDTTYKGFFLKQYSDISTTEKVMTFSTIGSDNTCLWGTKTSNDYQITSTNTKTTDTTNDKTTVSNNSSDTEDSASTTSTVTVKKTIKKLKSKKRYYFRVRAYKKSDDGNVYGSWSKVKSVKVK